MLGCPVSDYVGLGQLLFTVATHRQGRADVDWVPENKLAVFTKLTSRAAVEAVLERHFATGAEEERARAAAGLISSDPLMRQYTPNPLRARPLVQGFGCDYLIPVTPAVLGKVSPMGLYYTGMEQFGSGSKAFERFAGDLGELFEQYVGRHLRLLPDAEVHPEIVYDKDNKKSVDWIVVLPGLVLLLDAKSARPTAGLRLGPQDTFGEELNQKLGKAIEKQIPNTAKLIRDQHPKFAHIPHDRPDVRHRDDDGAVPPGQHPRVSARPAGHGRAHGGGLGQRTEGRRRRDGPHSGGGDPGPDRAATARRMVPASPHRRTARHQSDPGRGMGSLPLGH
jgi:hypothetical protein